MVGLLWVSKHLQLENMYVYNMYVYVCVCECDADPLPAKLLSEGTEKKN